MASPNIDLVIYRLLNLLATSKCGWRPSTFTHTPSLPLLLNQTVILFSCQFIWKCFTFRQEFQLKTHNYSNNGTKQQLICYLGSRVPNMTQIIFANRCAYSTELVEVTGSSTIQSHSSDLFTTFSLCLSDVSNKNGCNLSK